MDRRISLGLKVSAAVAALILGSIGLAYATGVDLPGSTNDKAAEVTSAVEKHEGDEADTDEDSNDRQGEGKSVSDAVHEVIEDRDGGGCEFGQAVAEAARANSQGDDAGAEDPCDHASAQADDAGDSEDKDKPAKTHEPKGSRENGSERAEHGDDDDTQLEDESDDSEGQDKDKPENNAGGADESDDARDDNGPQNDDDDEEEDELEDE